MYSITNNVNANGGAEHLNICRQIIELTFKGLTHCNIRSQIL